MTAYYIDESILEHHGVKGMKWGVVKDDAKTVVKSGLIGLAIKKDDQKRVKAGLAPREQRAQTQRLERKIAKREEKNRAFKEDSIVKNTLKYGLAPTLLGKTKLMQNHRKLWNAADKQTIKAINSGKKNINTRINKLRTTSLDVALVNVRDKTRGTY